MKTFIPVNGVEMIRANAVADAATTLSKPIIGLGWEDMCIAAHFVFRDNVGIDAHFASLPLTRFFGKPAVRVLSMADATACVFVVAELVAIGPHAHNKPHCS